jgi:hypothetical protein
VCGGARVEERHRRHPVAGVVDVEVPLAFFVVDQVPTGFAVAGHQRVEVHQRVDPVRDAVGDTGDHHAAVAVADEHEVVGVGVGAQRRDDVGHVGVEVDSGVSQVGAFGDTGEGVAQHPVAASAQGIGQVVEAPGAVAGARDQHVGGHTSTVREELL